MAEKQELYKLINDRTRMPRLQAAPQLHDNNLFDRNEHQQQQQSDLLQRFRSNAMKIVKNRPAPVAASIGPPQPTSAPATATGTASPASVAAKWKKSVNRLSRQTHYTEELARLAKQVPVQGLLLPEWERNIMRLIPRTNKRKHFAYLRGLMKEVRQDYFDEMQSFGVKSIVANREEEEEEEEEKTAFPISVESSSSSSSFETNRRVILYKYFLSHRLVRSVSNVMYYNLPKNLLSLKRYEKVKELVQVSWLRDATQAELQKSSAIVKKQCYQEIVRSMLQMGYLRSDKRLPRLLHCAESFMAQRICQAMMATIDELVSVLAGASPCPRLKLQLVCRNDRLEIEPSLRDVYALYHGLIDGVANLAQDLVPLSDWLKASDSNEQQPTTTASYVKVRLADWYLEESHAKLQSVLEAALQPLELRLAELAARLEPLCSQETRRRVASMIESRELADFDLYRGQVDRYKAYLAQVNGLVANEYFGLGCLNQSPAIAELKRNGHELVNSLLGELVDLHRSLNRDICREFESLESRALDIPDDTQSLFELTEYVGYASKRLMPELEDKIRASVRMLGSLSEVALLSHEHLELNATTCNWLELIKPVFSQHNIFCEAKKGELEDELQRKIAGLGAEIEAVLPELACLDAMDDASRVSEYRDFLAGILARIEEISGRCEQANAEERLFKFPETSFPKVEEIKETVSSFSSLVRLICKWQKERAVWLDGPFEYLDSELIATQTEHYTQRLTDGHRVYKLKIKTDQTASKPFKFSGVADDPDPMQQPAPLKLCWQTLRQLDEFRRYVPLAGCMCNPALRKRHWDEMSSIAGCDLTPNAGTTLAKLMALDLLEDFASYEVISRGANNELALQHELRAMQQQWRAGPELEFGLAHREASGLTEFRELDGIEALLEEQLVKLARMRSSYFVGPIEPQVREFHERLSRARRTIEAWNHVQARCKYLGGIFAEALLREHLPHELDLYESLRELLHSIEAGIQARPSFDQVTGSQAAVLDKLEQADRALELIASKVRDYLKRLKLEFSRLFFLADVEMVELLFRHANLARSDCQISKCFPNVSRLKLQLVDAADGSSLEIVAIAGSSGEQLDLPEPIELGSGECLADWLVQLDRAIQRALRGKLEAAVETFNDELSFDWLAASPASVVHCVWQIMWTAQVQSCFSGSVVEGMRECRQRYQAYKELAHQLLRHQTLSREHRETLSSLVVLLVHLEEVCAALLDKKIHEEQDFDWKAQIRYYYYNQEAEAGEAAEVRVSIVNSSRSYGYEYYGSGERVSVVTPLTERYYRALVEAGQQNHFTGLVGLACLGKIDAKRNLARILGQPFFLFGGREAQRYDNLEAIFKGLVGLNAWVCLKNLGECSLPNLSLLAQYIFRVCQAKSARQATINVHGDQLPFDANCYFSYSMTPGLGGEDVGSLPDNLRSHFRQVCFLSPDQDKICQVELYAAGFAEARQLSAVLSEVNALCQELMSSSTARYNLKLRSSKALVATAAKLKFAHPEESERLLLLRALVDTRISQFHGEDLLVFRDVLDKCFHGCAFPGPSHERLLAALERVRQAERLLDRAAFKLKVIQMHETIHLSESVILVGEAGSGKTTLLRALREVLTLIQADDDDDRKRRAIPCEVINPGALSLARFIGSYDEDKASWTDGVLCDALRRFSGNSNDNDNDDNEEASQKWLILDGDAHESWLGRIETMLAEPRVLYLATNERLAVPANTRLFIETTSLLDCSPATLARCALVHIPALAESWRDYARNELTKHEPRLPRRHCQAICAMFHWCLEPSLRFVRDNCGCTMKLSAMQLVGSCLDLFVLYIGSAIEDHNLEHKRADQKDGKDKDHALLWSQAALLMATNLALSGHLDADSKLKLEKFLLDLWANRNEQHPKPAEIKHCEIALPSEGQLRDNVYVFKGTGNWRHLAADLLKMEKIKDDNQPQPVVASTSDLFVPTVESLKFNQLLSLHVRYRRPFVVCGEYAAGKTCLLRDFFTNATSASSSELTSNYFNFKSIASAELAQELVLMRLQRIRRTEYQAQDDKYCVVVVDDLQAAADVSSTNSSTLESMRQLMDRGYWHDLETPGRRVAVSNKVAFAGALTTTTTSSHRNLCPRFLRHFNVLGMSAPTRESLCRVFSTSLMADLRRNSNFSQDVLGSVTSMAQASLDVYRACRLELRPSPARLLYRFSLHDVQRVVKGCALVHKDSVETKITFMRLWAHEVLRVFGDRIRDPGEQRWLFERMREAAKAHFKDPFEAAFDHLPKQQDELTWDSFRELFFGNWAEPEPSRRKYEEMSGCSRDQLRNKLQQYVADYNEANDDGVRKLELIVTGHAIEHASRICRVLATPGANLLALGTSGSGTGALVKLAAFVERQRLFEPALDSPEAWRQQLKSLMIECGTSKQHSCVLLVSERKIKAEAGGGVRDDVNELLLSYPGEIAARLFSEDERREMVRAARLDAQNGDRNLELDAWRVYGYFLEQCKRRLHLVLRVSPQGPSLKRCLRDWPGLLSGCTIDWLDDWPQLALEQVASHCLRGLTVQDSLRAQLVLASQQLYLKMDRARAAYHREAVTGIEFPAVAPLGFLRTCKQYAELMASKQLEIKSTRKRYLAGLDKLQLAAREVAHMKTTLTKLRPQLEASARQTEITMKEIESENLSVERATVLVKRDEEVANKKAEIASTLKLECETELAVAIPILEDALAALNTLKPTDITLVKAMKNPPDTVKLVMAAVCVMLGVPSERVVDPVTGRKSMDFWGPSKRVLGDMNFLQNLKDYDKDSIAPAVVATIKKNYMSDKNFQPHIVAKASSAAEGLCKWVRAMVSYDEVAKVVAPKKEKLAAAQRECDETEAFLTAKRKTLADLSAKLAGLKQSLEATLRKKLELEREVADCTLKLRKAEELIGSLGGEKARWTESANQLGRAYDNLPGDALLSCATIGYLAPLDLAYRDKTLADWQDSLRTANVPFSEEFDLVEFLGVEVTINAWRLCGLANNRFSLQNAIIWEQSPMWCLFVDPQNQANEWIRSMEKSSELRVVKANEPDSLSSIVEGMGLGVPVLLENVADELEAGLEPLLAKDGSVAPCEPGFRLYLTTRRQRPRFGAQVFNRLTVMDFLLPAEAIRDRLLDIVIARERPELQDKFEKILAENVNNKRILKQQEDNILRTLSSGSGTGSVNILEDEGAIRTLDISKSLAQDLLKRQEATRASKEEIEAFRDGYQAFTKYCADLYSTLNWLPSLNCMYRFSLGWFTQLYVKSIETSNRSVIHRKRIDYLKMSSIQNLYQSVHGALLERHRLVYSFVLCAKTLVDTEQLTEQEFRVFMSIGGAARSEEEDSSNSAPNPAPAWLAEASWRDLQLVSAQLTVFQNLANSLSNSAIRWRRYCNSLEADECPMPQPWDHRLTPFQKLILVRILCPDRIIFKVSEFVESVMGPSSGAGNFVPCNIARPYGESSCLVPLIFILPSYTSPFAVVTRFAKLLGYSSKLHSLSMGPRQGPKAELLIEMARRDGEWVFLHNCHLALDWMHQRLETLCEQLDPSTSQLGFRLWMSSRATEDFPIGLLQASIKVAFDAPHDVRQSLAWSYRSEPIKDRDFFEGCPGKDRAFGKLLYGFCLLHAVLRERASYGLQSWNRRYEFDEADLHSAIYQLRSWVGQSDKLPFKALGYFLSECGYGAKMLDTWDKLYLDSLALDYCNHKLVSDANYDFDTGRPAYRLPKRIEFRDYLRHIRNNVPAQTSPEDFGLDRNCTLAKNSLRVGDFLRSLASLSETSSCVPMTSEQLEARSHRLKSICLESLSLLPKSLSLERLESRYGRSGSDESPLDRFLREEVAALNQCLEAMRRCLEELSEAHSGHAADGSSCWSQRLEELSAELLRGGVPGSWQRLHLTLRTNRTLFQFLGELHPRHYWCAGLMSCRKLLAIVRWSYAREQRCGLDEVGLECSVLEAKWPPQDDSAPIADDSLQLPTNAICLYGLQLVGAKWNEQTKSLTNPRPKLLFNEMPPVSFEPVLSLKSNNSQAATGFFRCPLYVSPLMHNLDHCASRSLGHLEPSRDNYVASVNLKSDVNPRLWIKRGAALYCRAE
ncbi:unnamed protein product [Trichogramma brassicae]|uniref:AAA+ ATPase domain-containing protein n=1 Tax=Trichogramma brassicae TaxID=86971 RepID=A0A6H5IYR8_9HYME|nr:unnamed protein product [Trichogramma brassicae]